MGLWQAITLGAIVTVGFVEWFKDLDRKNKFKKLYRFSPIIPSAIVGFTFTFIVNGEYSWSWHVGLTLAILSVSVLAYKTIVEKIEKFLVIRNE